MHINHSEIHFSMFLSTYFKRECVFEESLGKYSFHKAPLEGSFKTSSEIFLSNRILDRLLSYFLLINDIVLVNSTINVFKHFQDEYGTLVDYRLCKTRTEI